MRGRFAPSPTGDLHLGGAFVAVASYVRARASHFAYVVRMEDLDAPRVVKGAADRILDDLQWLGLEWDEGPRVGGPYAPYEQSARNHVYSAFIEHLRRLGHVYPCTCSRAEIARSTRASEARSADARATRGSEGYSIASAPHAGEEGPRYPGTCRDPKNRKADRPAALRLRVPDDDRRFVTFEDAFMGPVREDVATSVGDFVLRRADGVASYQLAVTADDLTMHIGEVLRGADLLSSTARQILLARLIGETPPGYAHVPLVLGPDGERLAKRHQGAWRGSTIAELREMGVTREEILGEIGAALSLLDRGERIDMRALISEALKKPVDPRRGWSPPSSWLRRRA